MAFCDDPNTVVQKLQAELRRILPAFTPTPFALADGLADPAEDACIAPIHLRTECTEKEIALNASFSDLKFCTVLSSADGRVTTKLREMVGIDEEGEAVTIDLPISLKAAKMIAYRDAAAVESATKARLLAIRICVVIIMIALLLAVHVAL